VVVELRRWSGQQSSIAEGGEIFGGIEAEGGQIAERSSRGFSPGCAEGLSSIFDEKQIVAFGEGGEGVPVGALAVEVDGQDGFDLRRGRGVLMGGDAGFDRFGGEVEGDGVDVGQKGLGSAAEDGADGGEEAEGGSDNGIAGADVGGGEGQPEGVGSAGAADGVGHVAGLGGGTLEGVYGRAEDELLGGADLLDGGENFVANGGILPGEVEHGDGLKRFRRHLLMVNRERKRS